MREPTKPSPVAWLPHAGVARLVTGVLQVGADEILCEGWVPAGSPYRRGARCPSWVGIELGAQAAALLEAAACEEATPDGTLVGFLVRVREVRCLQPFADPEALLAVRATRLSAAPPLYVHTIEVRAGETDLLRGQISTYLTIEAGSAVAPR